MSRADDLYAELLRLTREFSVLASCGAVLSWDEAVTLPHGGSAWRGEQMGLLARLGHEMLTAPRIGELLQLLQSDTLGPDQTVNVREFRRMYDRAVKIPAKLVEELATVSTNAQAVWRDARRRSDFATFKPSLEKLVGLLREKADALGWTTSRYDALLDEYEPGASSSEIVTLFAQLRSELVPLLAAIRESGKTPDRGILTRDFPIDRQRLFAESAAAAIGFDFHRGRLDESTHPFCSGIGPGDCRLTTRYNAKFFNESFFGVLHEAGHGIYEQGLLPEHAGTPLGTFCSLGIHESQSRLWENQVGRGPAFWEHFFPRAKQMFPSLRDVGYDDWLFAVNDVQPSFIRVEADEANYNLHIILRFELEHAILAGELAVADIPEAWNRKFKEFFGIEVPNDAQGCLQDIHWSFGGLGYFPTYTLGNLYAAQFMDAARREMPEIESSFRRGDFTALKLWLNQKIHAPGMRWRANDLCERVTGSPLTHQPLMRYLREKYSPLYSLQG
jgi:carboxypeptidase Taq